MVTPFTNISPTFESVQPVPVQRRVFPVDTAFGREPPPTWFHADLQSQLIQSHDDELIYHLCTSSLYTPLNDAHVPITTCISDDAQFTQLTEPSTIVLEAQTSALAQRAVELS